MTLRFDPWAFAAPAFSAVTLLKISLFLILLVNGTTEVFLGDNAVDHYLPTAKRLLTEGRFNGPDSRPDSKVPPGYSVMIAAAMAVSPRHYLPLIVCLHMIEDLLTAVALYALARHMGRATVGFLAGLGWLLYPPVVAMSVRLGAEQLFTPVLLFALVALVLSFSHSPKKWSLVAGLLLGIATLVRGTTLALPLFLVPVWLLTGRRAQLLSLAGTVLIIGPWAVRNIMVLDDPIVVQVGFGSAFLQGSDDRLFTIDGKRQWFHIMFADARARGVVRPDTNHESQIDGWMGRVGLLNYQDRTRERPLSYIPFLADKFVRLWYATETGTATPQLLLGFFSLLILPAAFIQLWRWRAEPAVRLVVGPVILYFVALHIVVGPLVRYMLPIYPLFLLAAVNFYLECVPFFKARLLPVSTLRETAYHIHIPE